VSLKAINGVTGSVWLSVSYKLSTGLASFQSRHHHCKSKLCLSMIVYKLSLPLCSYVSKPQSHYHRLKPCEQYHHQFKALQNTHESPPNQTHKMSGRTYTTTVSYGPRTSSSSVSSRSSSGSAGYDSYTSHRVPVDSTSKSYHRMTFSYPGTDKFAVTARSSGTVYSVTRNGVSVTNHQSRRADPSEPRSSDYYKSSSSYRR
jgi:hypothetical protein